MNCNSALRDYIRILAEEEARNYRTIVGSLLYVVIKTRSDLIVVATTLSALVEKPCKSNLMAAKRVLCCLTCTEER